jgi:hypothetical protein
VFFFFWRGKKKGKGKLATKRRTMAKLKHLVVAWVVTCACALILVSSRSHAAQREELVSFAAGAAGAPRAQQLVYVNDGAFSGYQGLPSHLTNDPKSSWMDGTRGTEHLPHKVLKKLQSAEEQAGVEPEISGAGSHPSGEGLEDKMAKANVAGAPRAPQLRVLDASSALPAGYHILKPGQQLPVGARIVKANR